eukprot:5635340-Amphidinium_carterae.1
MCCTILIKPGKRFRQHAPAVRKLPPSQDGCQLPLISHMCTEELWPTTSEVLVQLEQCLPPPDNEASCRVICRLSSLFCTTMTFITSNHFRNMEEIEQIEIDNQG